MSSHAPPVPGIDASRLDAFLGSALPGIRPPLRYELIAGGRSNLTYLVTDAAGTRHVLRRPPLGHVLESAHDVGREARIMRALGPTAVPVPDVPVVCEDLTVTGAPFTVMAFVDGAIVRDVEEAAVQDPALRAGAGPRVAEALAALHAIAPGDVGLGDLGRQEDYVGRQLRRWSRQWEATRDRDVPEVEEAHRRLAADVPPQERVGIVHGDFRLDNLVLGPDGGVRAILDWELCTLGDPRADVGMLAAYWVTPDEPTEHLLSGTPTAAGGFTPRAEVLDRYARLTGTDAADLPFFVALNLWRLACIAEGIRVRFAAGAMGDAEGLEPAALAGKVAALATRALEILDGGSIDALAEEPLA